MKKLFILLGILLSGCGCLLSQIPPQTLYVNQNCEGILPDYRTRVIVTDNCPTGTTLMQSPIAGTVLTVLNPSVIVVITARDAFGNVSKPLNIPVTLIDTIAPILSFPIGQVNMSENDVVNLYKNWTAAIKIHGIARWVYDQRWTQGLAFADTTKIMESLKYFNNVIKLTDEEYTQYVAYMNNK
jgi:uncharacterized protein YceK